MNFWWVKRSKARQPQLMAGQAGYEFRRSRTLTGTTSVKVPVAARQKGQLKTARLKLHQLRAHQAQLLRALGGLLAAAGVVVYAACTFITTPSISFAQAGGQPNSAAYQQTVQRYFGQHLFERFGFALRPSELEGFLKEQHPELRTIVITRNWYGGNASLAFYFRQPLLVWQTSGQTFFVDDSGTAFQYNHFPAPTVVVTDQSGITPDSSGGAVASTRFISFLGRMVGAVNSYNKGRVVQITIPTSTRQIDLMLEGRNYPIKTHIDRDPLEQAEDIANALQYFDQKGIKPEYVDVRVGHRAFYKG